MQYFAQDAPRRRLFPSTPAASLWNCPRHKDLQPRLLLATIARVLAAVSRSLFPFPVPLQGAVLILTDYS